MASTNTVQWPIIHVFSGYSYQSKVKLTNPKQLAKSPTETILVQATSYALVKFTKHWIVFGV